MKKSRAFGLALLLIFFLFPLGAQEDDTPEPYVDLEFPTWMNDVRRGEIIFFGSLPFTVLFTTLAYQTVDFFYDQYWGDGDAEWGQLEESDRFKVLYISLGVSVSIAITDFILGKIFDDDKSARKPTSAGP